MTYEQSAAYINANAVAALIEAMGMAAENTFRDRQGNAIAYGEEAFNALIDKHELHWNRMSDVFRDSYGP